MTMHVQGQPVSPGMARGYAYIIGSDLLHVPRRRIAASVAGEECDRLESALHRGRDDLARLQEGMSAEFGRAEAEILEAHLRLLADPQLRERIRDHIVREQVNAEWAVEAIVQSMADALMSADNEYLRERATDVRDLGRRVLRHLSGDEPRALAYLPAGSILVARELYPIDLIEVDRAHLLGIATEYGGDTGHAAILARALGIPAVSGIKDLMQLVAPRLELLLDGDSGSVCIEPTPDQIALFESNARRYVESLSTAQSQETFEAQTLDGVRVGVYANIEHSSEAQEVDLHRLDGVGLFRTEYLFLCKEEAPTFEEHRAAYEDAAHRLRGRPLVIRTLDLGGDKFPRFLARRHELNPTLGLRGLKFSLTSGRALFETQVRALLAVGAAHRNVHVLLPMVLGPDDFSAAVTIIEQLAQQEKLREPAKVGAMIETPAAVLMIEEILRLADFASIGTNDLTQLILAADRDSAEVGHRFVLHPAVLRAIKAVADAAARTGKPLSVCGEAAADPDVATLLIGLGIRQLSMSASASARVRQRIREIKVREAEARAVRALEAKCAE